MKIIRAVSVRDLYTCRNCGLVTTNGEVDHRIPLHKDGSNDMDNLQWLCTYCHSNKSIKENGGKVKARIGLDGYPVV